MILRAHTSDITRRAILFFFCFSRTYRPGTRRRPYTSRLGHKWKTFGYGRKTVYARGGRRFSETVPWTRHGDSTRFVRSAVPRSIPFILFIHSGARTHTHTRGYRGKTEILLKKIYTVFNTEKYVGVRDTTQRRWIFFSLDKRIHPSLRFGGIFTLRSWAPRGISSTHNSLSRARRIMPIIAIMPMLSDDAILPVFFFFFWRITCWRFPTFFSNKTFQSLKRVIIYFKRDLKSV